MLGVGGYGLGTGGSEKPMNGCGSILSMIMACSLSSQFQN